KPYASIKTYPCIKTRFTVKVHIHRGPTLPDIELVFGLCGTQVVEIPDVPCLIFIERHSVLCVKHFGNFNRHSQPFTDVIAINVCRIEFWHRGMDHSATGWSRYHL